MQRVAITTLGCKINQFESAAMSEALDKEGFRLVPFEDEADVYLINTCTVTAKTDAESRKLIRRAGRRNPQARIVVTGCYAQVAFEELREMAGVDLIVGNVEKKGIAGLLREVGSGPRVLVSDISLEREVEGLVLESFAEHTRAFLQVQNGCDAFCSYCIVPYARGRSRSVPLHEVLAGIGTFAAKGFREVVLTGIHLGGYGLDLAPQESLASLLAAIEERRLVPRLRVGSVEPTEVSDALVTLLASSETVCPHLHIPLQSGSDTVLGRMNRNYSTALFREVVEKLAAAVPDICIGCDVIAGFPGETEEEFAETLRFVEALPIAHLHVFPFSPRQGTPAATMPGQVHGAVVRSRATALRRLSDRKKRAFYQGFLGRELRVLVQGREPDGLLKGLSRNYIPVFLAGDESLINSEVTVRVTEVARESVRGERAGCTGRPLIPPVAPETPRTF
ncbi:MAG: tRNA (N(6)-L-threonylcarbamoyladenosine(37)-C(2))-methylthiotransferase MtaB [Geobacteraceae bacterium]|nr:tRNA (N(6)-L-threonylcarbamoyladenosine(37)-C(2))-methylthiotransferase MtaB [Geobacteraceae bacterium]